jgi:hypothetical protein
LVSTKPTAKHQEDSGIEHGAFRLNSTIGTRAN